MKTKIGILVLALCTVFFNVQAQRRVVTTTRAISNDISDNLDLEAVASLFGESSNLEDFENRLNNPNNHISNLDLNKDGYIDYLRVLENSSDRNSLVVIQDVLDQDVFQDVATIEIERQNNGNHRVQIIGNDYLYGPDYIIEPVFWRTPLIFSFFWGPHYTVWNSPYYWNYYPRWYRHYRPFSPFKYRKHIYARINYENKYRHENNHAIHFSDDAYNKIRRSDYASKHPDRSFTNRYQGVGNRNELIKRRSDLSGDYQRNNTIQRPNNIVKSDRPNPSSGKNERQRSLSKEKSGTIQTQPSENRKPSETRTRPVTTPERSSNQLETTKSSSVSTEKSSAKPDRSRSDVKVKPNKKVEKKSEPTKKETKEKRRRND